MKTIPLGIVVSLIFNSVAFGAEPAWTPQTPQEQTQQATQAAKVKAEVQKRGAGEKSRVKVRLRNKTEVKGHISKMDETSFAVTDEKTGQVVTIPYADVEKIGGPGLSKSTKIGIAVVVGLAVVGIVIAIGRAVIAAHD